MRNRKAENYPGSGPPPDKLPRSLAPASEIPLVNLLVITKEQAAKEQLLTAVKLWFSSPFDPVSVHTLVGAAHNCYHALSSSKGMPSLYKTWLDNQSRLVYDQVQYAEEFFKHGQKDLKGEAYLDRNATDIKLLDCIRCHDYLFHEVPHLYMCFLMRFAAERPWDAALNGVYSQGPLKLTKELREISRPNFLAKILPIVRSKPVASAYGKPSV